MGPDERCSTRYGTASRYIGLPKMLDERRE